jgi:hypothetical protein
MIAKEYIETYDRVKQIVLFTEAINDTHSLPVLNEYRNAFDHLVRFLKDESAKNEIDQSIAHLKRTALDSYYLTISLLYKEIERSINDIGEKDLEIRFPKFQKSVLPRIRTLRNEAVHGLRPEEIDLDQLTENLNQIIELQNEIKRVKSFSRSSKKKVIFGLPLPSGFWLGVIIAIIAALISSLVSIMIKNIVPLF